MSQSLEYIIVGFPDNDFSGEIAGELAAVIEAGIVKIVDILLVSRGDDGSVLAIEVDEDESLSVFAELEGDVGGIIGPDDIEHAAASIAAGSSVLLIVWENLWAAPLAGAIERSGGVLIEGGRIPAALADAAIAATL